MTFNLLELWGHMGFLNRLITVTLIVMGLACLTVFVERLIALSRARRRAEAFSVQVAEPLEAGELETVRTLAAEAAASHLSELTAVAVAAFTQRKPGNLTPLDRARRDVDRYLDSLDSQLKRGMPVLATVGSISPFIGLLGTVVGIIVAFKGISETGSGGIASVAAGISEALVETALGLLVAIPAVLMFNFLSTKIERFQASVEQAASKLLDVLEDLSHGDHDQQRAA